MNEETAASSETPYVSYHQSPDGYYVLTFFESSHRAIDQWAQHVAHITEISANAERICILYDIRRSGMPPMMYMAEKAKELIEVFPVRPPLRVAGVYQNQLFFRLVNKFVDLVASRQRDQIQFFKATELDNAVAWLREGIAAPQSQSAGASATARH
jgi:hypothetical protein